jgi:predicted CXXCH cytochrome family protein
MRWISENKGSAASLVLAAIALMVLAVFLLQGLGSEAEAVLGGQGNLRNAGPNHPHNLSAGSNYARATGESQICIFCHTPHHAMVNVGPAEGKPIINAPLWNHELSDVTYTVKPQGDYSALSNTITLLTAVTNKPDGASRLCLSCHDGEVSIGAIYSRLSEIAMVDACTATGGGETAGLGFDTKGRFGALTSACMAYIGRDLTSKHVVSVAMNADLIAASIANCSPPGTATMRLQYPWQGSFGDKVLLRPTAETYNSNLGVTRVTGKYRSGYNYGVQCSTCHDPHYWTVTSGPVDSEGERMLVESFNNLCTSCHITTGCTN